MEGSNEQDKAKKGLEGTAIDLPTNRRVNLKSATSDDDFTNILAHIKSSKTPVSPTTSLQINFFFSYCFVCVLTWYMYFILMFGHKIVCRLSSNMALLGMLPLLPSNASVLIVLHTRSLMLDLFESVEIPNCVVLFLVEILFTWCLEVYFVWIWRNGKHDI